MELARLITDLEPNKRSDYTFLFTARFDCEFDKETIDYVSQKFNVKTFKTTRRSIGWPDGPNQMAGESYEWCANQVKSGVFSDPHNCVLMMEADCVPLSARWKDDLADEFTNSRKMVSGAWLEPGDAGCRHINGNMIISLDFIKRCPMLAHPPHRGGWDAVLAQHIMPFAHPSALIWSDYQLGQLHNPWRGCDYLWTGRKYNAKTNPRYGQVLQPVWMHGCKSIEAIKCVRDKLLPK